MTYKLVQINPPFDIEVNFWKNNKQLKHIEPYKTLHDLDDGGEMSSKTMWCVWLMLDPNYDNKIGKIKDIKERKSAILSYNPTLDFEDKLFNDVLTAYPQDCLTPAAKAFQKEQETLVKLADEIQQYLSDNKLTFDQEIDTGRGTRILKGTATQAVDMKTKVAKLYPIFDNIKKQFEEEQSQIRIYGGGKETAMESNSLMNLNEEVEVVE